MVKYFEFFAQCVVLEEIKSTLNQEIPSKFHFPDLLPPPLLLHNIEITIKRTIILPVSLWVKNLVAEIKGRMQIKDGRQQGA